MLKKYSLALFSVFLLLNASLFAQTKPSKSGKKEEKKEAPTESQKEPKKESKKESKKGESKDVQVFDAKDDYDYFEKKNNSNPKNVIKINPLEILNGTFPIFYERVVAPKVSVEVGLGVTAVSAFYSALQQELSNNQDYDGLAKGKTGLMFKIGARYYAGRRDEAPEGPYLGVEYQVKKYVYDAFPYTGGYRASSGPTQEASSTDTDLLRILFGYQSDNSNNFSWDPYIGIGWRKHTFNGWYLDENSKAILGSVSSSKPVFLIGVKMGLRF